MLKDFAALEMSGQGLLVEGTAQHNTTTSQKAGIIYIITVRSSNLQCYVCSCYMLCIFTILRSVYFSDGYDTDEKFSEHFS